MSDTPVPTDDDMADLKAVAEAIVRLSTGIHPMVQAWVANEATHGTPMWIAAQALHAVMAGELAAFTAFNSPAGHDEAIVKHVTTEFADNFASNLAAHRKMQAEGEPASNDDTPPPERLN